MAAAAARTREATVPPSDTGSADGRPSGAPRSAHLVGLSADGGSLVLATENGDELAVPVDDRLRAALRGGRPRPSRLENEMDSSLSPRDIQARIRAGESLEALADVAGLPYDRVERFAAPVLAEREHVALLAVASPVRRRGETSAHRILRVTVAERLLRRGIDTDTINWDAYRLEDGRWAVTADYRLEDSDRHAAFTFDQRGRYSVAADDEARWLIGEEPLSAAPPGRRQPGRDAGDEPTVDLSDELALVRATQEAERAPQPDGEAAESADEDERGPLVMAQVRHEQTEVTVVRTLTAVPDDQAEPEAEPTEEAGTAQLQDDGSTEAAETTEDVPGAEEPSELTTLYAMLGSDGYSEDSPRVYAGLSDASAVPETAGGGWEPAIVLDYPVEPSPQDEAELPPGEHPDRSQVPMNDKAPVELSTPMDAGARRPGQLPGTDEPAPPYARTNEADRAEEAEEFQLESELPPEPKPKRKRASVPSWDEIMFGGPKPPS
ncbi:MAG: septation protein SepH [Friedmanniella sp.]